VRLREVAPLPPEAFRARLTLAPRAGPVPPGARFTLRLTAENLSPVVWPRMGYTSRGRVLSASYHWKRPDGSVAVHDGRRTPLRSAVRPGARIELALEIVAPDAPGAYLLEADLVQEGVAWFADRGSEVVRTPVTVGVQGVTPSRS
jgi:hypothetical protein